MNSTCTVYVVYADSFTETVTMQSAEAEICARTYRLRSTGFAFRHRKTVPHEDVALTTEDAWTATVVQRSMKDDD